MALVRGDAQLGSLHANLPGNVSEQCSCERMITQPVCGCGGKGGGGEADLLGLPDGILI